jgi:hypothetical protein
LPNLETKFVAADTLLRLSEDSGDTLDLKDDKLKKMKNELWDIRRSHFYAKDSEEKKRLQREDEEQRNKISAYLIKKGNKPDKNRIANLEKEIETLQQKRLAVAGKNFVDEVEVQGDLDLGINQSPKNLFQTDKNKPKRDSIDREIKKLTAEISKEQNKGKNLQAFEDAIKSLALWNPYDQNKASPFFDSVWMFGVDKGFDIVIGNPPYIQLQNNHGELASKYQNCNFLSFTRTGDIYQLFYEKGINLLCQDGILCFITSNKWMRAGYGEETRKYFSENIQTLQLIDFAGQKVFESATVDVSIAIIKKNNNPKKTMACTIKQNSSLNLTDYVKQNGNMTLFSTNGQSWVILSDIERRIKEKIENIGKPLKDWNINIYRGILTGCNEAFIVNKEKRDELIKKCPKSAEIIRPILRGRDIKRYGYEFADLYLLFIPWHFPLHLDTTITGASKEAEIMFKEEYLGIYNHLLKYKDILSDRNAAETGIRYEWYALQRWGANYWDDFSKQKITWGNLNLSASFTLAPENMFINAPATMIVPGDKYLLGILNSKLADYFIRNLGVTRNGGYFEYKPMFVSQMPVPLPSPDEKERIEVLVTKIINQKKNHNDFTDSDVELNNTIYKQYLLSYDEKEFVNSMNSP